MIARSRRHEFNLVVKHRYLGLATALGSGVVARPKHPRYDMVARPNCWNQARPTCQTQDT
jgi:hypothetical protein